MTSLDKKFPKKDMDQAPIANSWGSLPELLEGEFMRQVVHSTIPSFEEYLDNLVACAANLGIPLSRPSTAVATPDKRNTIRTESSATLDTNPTRSASAGSSELVNTPLTSPSFKDFHLDFPAKILTRKLSKAPTFSQYEDYLANLDPHYKQSALKTIHIGPHSTPSLLSSETRKSLFSLRHGLSKIRPRRKSRQPPNLPFMSCSACREDPSSNISITKLPCGHIYCARCLRIMINQATAEETKMPPRCCTQPVPSTTIKRTLPREEQSRFLKAVLQYSTPWESRVFCSNLDCGEFIPPRTKVDTKRPFEVTCSKCRTRVCLTCKGRAHPLGQDCPQDWESTAVLEMGEKSGWRRCYKCRSLVELTQGCTHMTCRCKAQFCYICGAVWDSGIGCPNFCNGEEEMERRRLEELDRIAAIDAEMAAKQAQEARDAAERIEAERRTQGSEKFQLLHSKQLNEMEQFHIFERKCKWLMWTRHSEQKLALLEKQQAVIEKIQERHAKTAANLEDRQIAAEMELRTSLEQSEKSVKIRLRHMEAYCAQQGDGEMPERTVTARDLRELDQQYTLEKNMKQVHKAKINVLRDRQAKALEQLLERQEQEMDRATEKHQKEKENMDSGFADEEDILSTAFVERRAQLTRGWKLDIEILRMELEKETGQVYALAEPPEWPQKPEAAEDDLPLLSS